MLTPHSDLDHAHADTKMSKRHPRRYRRFSFFGTSLPQNKGGEVGWGRPTAAAAKSAATAAAAAARARGNEINTPATRNRLHACEVVVF